MSRIRRAMRTRYIMFMTVLVISLTALLLSLSNFTDIQASKVAHEYMKENVYIVRNV